jgi:hypothetical protein
LQLRKQQRLKHENDEAKPNGPATQAVDYPMNIEQHPERLRQVLRYEPETGRFYWLERIARSVTVGSEAGSDCPPYGSIQMFSVRYAKHRLAFVWMTGVSPLMVDHINGVSTDNRWCNLREANDAENQWNQKLSALSTTGAKNVHFCATEKRRKRYGVSFRVDGKVKNFGRFETLQEASAFAEEVRKVLHGEFARSL